MNRLAIPTTALLGLTIGGMAYAAPSLRQDLDDYQTAQELSALMDEAAQAADEAERARLSILRDLPATLVGEFLVPTISGGSFSKAASGDLTYHADLSYAASGDVTSVLTRLKGALGTTNSGETVCLTTGDSTKKLGLRGPSVDALLVALGTSADALAPVTTYAGRVDDNNLMFAESLLGEDLFAGLGEAIDKLGSTDDLQIYLDVEDDKKDAAEEDPVELTLTTVDGQKLRLEVELDGPGTKKTELPEKANWRFGGTTTRVEFDKSVMGHVALLLLLMDDGQAALDGWEIAISDLETRVHYPTHYKNADGPDYSFHAMGAESAWFGTASLQVKGNLTVYHSASGCDTNVVITPRVDTLALGPLPEAAWDQVTSFKSVEAGTEEVELGYLEPPDCASDSSGISNEDFDEVMGRGTACQKRCDAVGSRIEEILQELIAAEQPAEDATALNDLFGAVECRTTCMQSKGYRGCLDTSVDARNDDDFLVNATSCEERRP